MIKKFLPGSRLSSRITSLNLVILVLVLAVVLALSLVTVTGITDSASRRIAHLHSQESLGRLMSHLNNDLALLRKVGNSRAVQEWFADEHNPEKKYAALNELQNMAPFIQIPEFYMGVAGSLNEYIIGLTTTVDEFLPHGTMSPYVYMDEWFFNMMSTDLSFTFNVDIDKATHTWNVWILYRVVHDGRDVGLLCIPFRIEYVLGDVFGQYDDEFIRGYIVDGNGFIHIESGVFDHYALWEYDSVHVSHIDEGLGEFVYIFTRRDEMFFAADAEIAVAQRGRGQQAYAALAPIPHSTWMILTLFDSRVLFSIGDILPVILILVSAFIGFAFFSMLIIRRSVLVPIESLAESVSLVTNKNTKDDSVYGENRTDEIGDLARTIRQMLEAERDNNELNQAILVSAPLVVALWEEDGKPVTQNEQTLDFFGVPDAKMLTDNLYDFSPDFQPCGTPSPEKASMYFQKALEEGYVRFEWLHKNSDGELLPAEVVYKTFKRKDKTILLSYTIDLREIKKAESARQRLEVAEESNRAKSRFLARMSHEIRTPINAVMGISTIHLQDPHLSPEMEESLVKIHNSSNLLLGIVNDILDLSRIESGKMTILNERYDVASMINDVTSLYTANLNNENIKYQVSVDEKLPAILIGDMLRIEQIINNLLSNAIKYTEFGSVELSFLREDDKLDDDSITLVVGIRDTGLGMTAEQIELLSSHREYTRFHENENRFIGGTGLGMPITYSIAEIMEAKINIESEVGKGTNVVVRIPQKIASPETLGAETSDKLQQFQANMCADTKRYDFTPEPMPYGKVLVVDDTDANLYVAKGLLAFYNLNIETCTSGHEVIEKIKAGKVYDVILMDNMMPDLSGTEAMIILRSMGYNEPIVVVTASALLGQVEEFKKSGFDDYISKPIQPKVLDSALNKFIRDKQPPEVIEAAKTEGNKPKTAANADINDYQHSDELVSRLRTKFVRNHKNIASEITNALAADDIVTAHRLAHTLRSVAGLIHEHFLVETAERIERMLGEGNEKPTPQQLSVLKEEVRRVIEDIGEDELLPPDESEYVGKDEALALLERLEPLLKTHDASSIKMLDELRKIPQSILLCNQIDDFDFKSALETMMKMRDELG